MNDHTATQRRCDAMNNGGQNIIAEGPRGDLLQAARTAG